MLSDSPVDELKNIVDSQIAVAIPDFSKPFILTTDASNSGLGAVLQQIPDMDGERNVIGWASRLLSNAEQKYTVGKEYLMLTIFFPENL